MKRALLPAAALALALFAAPALADPLDPSASEVWVGEGVYQTVNLVDMGQTLDIRHHPGFSEENLFLGPHPSDAHVVEFKLGVGLAHAAVTALLLHVRDTAPPKLAPVWGAFLAVWEVTSIASQTAGDVRNASIGLHVRF